MSNAWSPQPFLNPLLAPAFAQATLGPGSQLPGTLAAGGAGGSIPMPNPTAASYGSALLGAGGGVPNGPTSRITPPGPTNRILTPRTSLPPGPSSVLSARPTAGVRMAGGAAAGGRGAGASTSSAANAARTSTQGAQSAAAKAASAASTAGEGGGLGSRLAAGLRASHAASGGGIKGGAKLLGTRAGMIGMGGLAGQAASAIAGGLGASQGVRDDLGRMGLWAGTGAALGSVIPGIGTGIGAGIGAIGGALGFIPGIENLPLIGGLWGGGGGQSKSDINTSARNRMAEALTLMGADQSFIQRGNQQLDIAYTLAGFTRKQDGSWDYKKASKDEIEAVAAPVIQGMIQQFGLEQQNTMAMSQLNGNFGNAQAQIMAAQAHMMPMMQDAMARNQHYADLYAQSATATAQNIQDPNLRAAAEQLAASYGADQSYANMMALTSVGPQAMQNQLQGLYDQQMMALQQQQLQLQQQEMNMAASSLNPYGSQLAQGLYPTR